MGKPKLEKVPRKAHTHHVGRTLEWFRSRGFLCAKVEKRATIIRPGMPRGMCMIGPSQDLFGVADIVAIPPPEYAGRKGTWYVQVCARGGGSAHRSKALAAVLDGIPVLPRLTAAGCRFVIVNYELGRTIPKAPRKDGRLIWTRRVEEYIPEVKAEEWEAYRFAGFVDWGPTDFELVENLPKCVKPKTAASRAPTATSSATAS